MIQSILFSEKFYIGITKDLKARLQKHNEGGSTYTVPFKPWKIETTVAFINREKAYKFERYLETHSSRAFAKNNF